MAAHKVQWDDRMVWKDPNAGEQHVYGSPGKLLKKRQGLWIPWYLARKDYDYLHVLLRLVAVPVANVVNPFSDPVSFAVGIRQRRAQNWSRPRSTYRCQRSIRRYPVARLSLSDD
jgi:hypothetical protein